MTTTDINYFKVRVLDLGCWLEYLLLIKVDMIRTVEIKVNNPRVEMKAKNEFRIS